MIAGCLKLHQGFVHWQISSSLIEWNLVARNNNKIVYIDRWCDHGSLQRDDKTMCWGDIGADGSLADLMAQCFSVTTTRAITVCGLWCFDSRLVSVVEVIWGEFKWQVTVRQREESRDNGRCRLLVDNVFEMSFRLFLNEIWIGWNGIQQIHCRVAGWSRKACWGDDTERGEMARSTEIAGFAQSKHETYTTGDGLTIYQKLTLPRTIQRLYVHHTGGVSIRVIGDEGQDLVSNVKQRSRRMRTDQSLVILAAWSFSVIDTKKRPVESVAWKPDWLESWRSFWVGSNVREGSCTGNPMFSRCIAFAVASSWRW